MADPGTAGRRLNAQAVNFGVAAIARATGAEPNTTLALRCECGAADCDERVVLTQDEYQALTLESTAVLATHHSLQTP